MRRLIRAALIAATVGALLMVLGGIVGPVSGRGARTTTTTPAVTDARVVAISRMQDRLREVPGDFRTWAQLGATYVEQARVTADPTYYAKAESALRRSLELRPRDNADALVGLGALANARHDFAAARRSALDAAQINPYDPQAFGVLADAETQLGNDAAATQAVQRMLDLRPGLAALSRASYDRELHGDLAHATELMRRALDASVDPRDVAFCRGQLGGLAWRQGDLDTAEREYATSFAADPGQPEPLAGRARVHAARGRTSAALADWAEVTRRSPTPQYLIEHAELLRAAGRAVDADTALRLADAGLKLLAASGGRDGLAASQLAAGAGRAAEALREAQAEWRVRRHPDVRDALAWALHLAGRDREALGVVRLGAPDATHAFHAGLILLSLGDRAGARRELASALARNPSFSPLHAPTARAALAALGGS